MSRDMALSYLLGLDLHGMGDAVIHYLICAKVRRL